MKPGFVIGINTLCIDCITTVESFPKEGQAVRGLTQERYPGGKGPNAILAVQKSGAKAKFYSTVNPVDAPFLLKNLQKNKIDISGVRQSEKTQTAIANVTQHIMTGDHTVVTFNAQHEITSDIIDESDFSPDNTLMLQSKLPENTISKLIIKASHAGCKITMNMCPVKKLDKKLIGKLNILVINEHEAGEIVKFYKISNKDQDEVIAQDIADYFGIQTIITRGHKQVILAEPNQPIKTFPVIKLDKVISTLGAGDGFFGMLTGRLHSGDSLDMAINKAIIASAIICTRLAPQSCPDIKEIEDYLSRNAI